MLDVLRGSVISVGYIDSDLHKSNANSPDILFMRTSLFTMSQTSVFQRSFAKSYPTAAAGEGVYIRTASGSRCLDGSSGAAVSCLGHGHPAPIRAIVEQAQRMAFAHTSFFTNDPTEALASLLLEQSNRAFAKVLFLSSGMFIAINEMETPANGSKAPKRLNRA